jgi:tetratricopeptide (TPR) repeat protein
VPALVAVVMLVAQTLTRRTAALAGLALLVSLGGAREARAQWGRNPGDLAWSNASFRAAAEHYLAQVRSGQGGDTAWFNLGTAALAVGDTALAGRALERAAASLDPDLRFRALYNAGLLALRLATRDSVNRERHLADARERYREALLLRPADRAATWNLELSIHRSKQGGGGETPKQGGGGGSGGQSQPPPPAPESGLTRAQAEQVLNSIANEERQVRQGLSHRRMPQGARGVKNW